MRFGDLGKVSVRRLHCAYRQGRGKFQGEQVQVAKTGLDHLGPNIGAIFSAHCVIVPRIGGIAMIAFR